MWEAMSQPQRAKAIQRLGVVLRFEGEKPPTVERGAADAGLTLNRWYEMHRRWRQRRSLSSLGTFAAVPRTRKLAYHVDLQRLVVKVIDGLPERASVRQAALALGEALGAECDVEPEKRPSYNTLRKFAEAEQRRRAKEEAPGNELMLDCCACTLPHANENFVAFLAFDKATRLVLGAALGDPAHSRDGYRRAAADALARIETGTFERLDWAESMARSEVVLGFDGDALAPARDVLAASGLGLQLQPATSKRRFGMYVRRLLGERMGRVRFYPGRTGKMHASQPSVDDVARFEVEVEAHDAGLLAARRPRKPSVPTPGLIRTLHLLATD